MSPMSLRPQKFQLPAHKVERSLHGRVVRVEPFSLHGLPFYVVHVWLDAASAVTVPGFPRISESLPVAWGASLLYLRGTHGRIILRRLDLV